MQVIAHLLAPFIDLVEPINVLILLWLLAWMLIALAVAIIIILARHALVKASNIFREWQDRREAEALKRVAECKADDLRVTEDSVDIGMAPSLAFLNACLNGIDPLVVEDLGHDLKCHHPCSKHSECQMAS